MKKKLSLILALVLVCLLWQPALAVEAASDGICGITDSQVITGLKTADDVEVSARTVLIDGKQTPGYYPDAVRFSVTAADVTAGEEYIVFVLSTKAEPTSDNIVYVNQKKAESTTLVFDNVYPKAMTEGVTYSVYVVGDNSAFDAEHPLAAFQYRAPRYNLSLQVTSADTGDDVIVELLQNDTPLTPEEGTLTWKGLTGGEYEAKFTKPGFVSRTERISLSCSDSRTVQLVRTGDVNGNGAPVTGPEGATDMQCLYTYLSTRVFQSQITDNTYKMNVADVNGDDTVNILDYQYLYEMVKMSAA